MPQRFLLCPRIDSLGAYNFWRVCLSVSPLSVRPFVCPQKLLRWPYLFVFHMSIPSDKTLLLVLSSRSSVKVRIKYQGHSFRKKKKKKGRCGGKSVSQTQLLF